MLYARKYNPYIAKMHPSAHSVFKNLPEVTPADPALCRDREEGHRKDSCPGCHGPPLRDWVKVNNLTLESISTILLWLLFLGTLQILPIVIILVSRCV